MRKLVIMAIALTTVSCASHPPVPKQEVVEESSGGAQEAQEIARKLDVSKATTQTFEVGYTIDYGFTLNRSSDRDKLIEPVFVDVLVQMEMNRGYEDLINRPDIAGKRILCECQGVSFKLYNSEFFRITKSRLYAE